MSWKPRIKSLADCVRDVIDVTQVRAILKLIETAPKRLHWQSRNMKANLREKFYRGVF